MEYKSPITYHSKDMAKVKVFIVFVSLHVYSRTSNFSAIWQR
jgi:hypothetical protein